MIGLFDFIFPKRCVVCKKVGKYICIKCRKTIQLLPQKCSICDRPTIDGIIHPICQTRHGMDGLITVFQNRGVIKQAIKTLKYRFVYDLAESLVNLIPFDNYPTLNNYCSNFKLYPIPLHPDRFKWRGFNQAEKLGQFIAKKLNIQLIDGLLIRQAKRMPQADIARREDRIKNAQGLFISSFKPQTTKLLNVLLFDDVWTTGATMKEAAKVLKRNGVKKVWGMTIAR
jgi:competence protein ComFC